MRGTPGTETSKYREEEKSTEILRVVASESGRGQTRRRNTAGVRTVTRIMEVSRTVLGKPVRESENLVGESGSEQTGSRVSADTRNPVRT